MHSIITSCSCVISMDLTVCHKQIAEEWRQQIIVVAKHKFSSIERIDLEISRISNLENRGGIYVLDSLNFIGVCKAKARRHFFLLISPINLKTEIIKLELNNDMLKVNEQRRQPAKFTWSPWPLMICHVVSNESRVLNKCLFKASFKLQIHGSHQPKSIRIN